MEKLNIKQLSSQAESIGTVISIAGAFIVIPSSASQRPALYYTLEKSNWDLGGARWHPVDSYLTRFSWDEAKYPTKSHLKEIVDGIQHQVAKIEDDLKVFSSWMHFCAVCLLTESILRYGLPPSFLACVLSPTVKGEKKVRSILEGLCKPYMYEISIFSPPPDLFWRLNNAYDGLVIAVPSGNQKMRRAGFGGLIYLKYDVKSYKLTFEMCIYEMED